MEQLLEQLDNDFDESLLDFLADLNNNEFDFVMFKLIHSCFINDNKESAIKIIDYCEVSRLHIDPLPTITVFFINPYFNVEMLKWVTSLYQKESSGYFLDIINSRNDDVAIAIAEKLLIIFPNINEQEWIQLAELTENFEDEEYENIELRNFLLAQTNNYSKLPDWLIEVEEENIIDYNELPNYPKDIPNVEDAIKMILDDFEKLNIDFTEINEEDDFDENKIVQNLTAQYAISTSQERIAMLSNVVNIPFFDDSDMFKQFGPVNSSCSCSLIIDDNHECIKYGGCRMLLCNEYPEFDIYGEKIDLVAKNIITTDWFRNKCDLCNKKIRSKNHALRLPLQYGGWQGCYCSFECLSQNINNVITALIVGRMKSQLYTIGINNI